MSGDKFEKLLLDVGKTLAERQSQHGTFVHQAMLSQSLFGVMFKASNYGRLTPYQRESLVMIQIKIARILEGDCNHIDHWHDIAGYATLVERVLRQDQEKREARGTAAQQYHAGDLVAPGHPIRTHLRDRTHLRELMEDVTEAEVERRCIKGETAK